MPERQISNLLLEQSNDLIWIIDSDFCLTYANQAYQNVIKQVTGEEKKMDEPIFTEGFIYGSTEKWKSYYERGLNGEHFEIEEQFYNPHTNQVEYSEISFKPLTNENKVVVNVACQSRDITSYIKTNTEAEKLLDASLDVICSIDEQGNFTKVNAACKELWGYEKHELIGKAYISFVIEEDIEKTNLVAADIIAGKSFTTFENRYKRKDGGIAFNLWSARWDPKTQTMFCVARDAREKIKKEELLVKSEIALKQSEARLKGIIDSQTNYVLRTDLQGNYIYCNQKFIDDFGWLHGDDNVELIGVNCMVSIMPYHHQAVEDVVKKCFANPNQIFQIEIDKPAKNNGVKTTFWDFILLTDSEGRPDEVQCSGIDISKRIKAEKDTKEANQRFELINEATFDTIWDYNLIKQTLYWGASFKSIFGYNIVGLQSDASSWTENIHPEDSQRITDSLNKARKGSDDKWFEEYRFRKSDLTYAYVVIKALIVRDEDGNALRMLGAIQDITENVNMLKAKEADDQFNKTVIESSPDCLKILDNEGRLVYMNFNGLCQMEIDDFSEFENKQWWLLWGPENEALVRESVDKALRGETIQFTALCPTAKGTPKWWDVTVSPVIKEGEPIEKIISVSRDITAKKEEEQRLKLLESVITHTNDAVLITEAEPFDEPGPRILYVNEAFTRMTGYTAEEVIGKSPRILQGPNSDKAELARMGKALRNWDSCEITTINYKKNGDEFWINFAVSPVADETGWYTHWIAIERDVTENKKLELATNLTSKISAVFNVEPDLSSALSKLCEEVAIAGMFSFCEIWLTDIQESLLELKVVHKKDKAATIFYENSILDTAFERGQGVPGKIWEYNQSIIWEHKGKNQELLFRSTAAEKAGIKTIVGFPLMYHDKFIGVLEFGTQEITKNVEWIIDVLEELGAFIGAEIARKKIEIELAQIFNFTPDLICTSGFDGYIKRINPAGLALLGYSLEEILSRPIISFIHEQDRLLTRDKQLKLYSGEDLRNFENRYITKEGKIVWLSWTSTSLPDQGIVYAVAKNITEEKSLRELNRLVGELAKIGSWEVDVVNQTVFWSDEVHQIYGTDPRSFVPSVEAAIKFYREDFRELALSSFENCIVTQEPYTIEAVIVNCNKKEVWVRTTAKAEFIDGVCTLVYGSFQDIHQLKESQLELLKAKELAEENEHKMKQAQKLAHLGSWYYDVVNQVSQWSDETYNIWGLNPDITSVDFVDHQKLIHPKDWERYNSVIKNAIEKGIPYKIDLELVRPDGSYKTVNTIGDPIFDENNKVIAFKGTTQDISDRIIIENELRSAIEKAEKSLKSLEDYKYSLDQSAIIAFTDNKGIITSVNDNFCKISKYEREEIIGKTHRLINSKHHPKEFFNDLWKTIASGKVWRGEIKNKTKDGSYYWVDTTIVPFLDESNNPLQYLAIRFDITERKKAEQEKNSLLTTLEKSLNEIYVFDAETLKFSYVNQGALINLGYSEQEINELTPLDLKPEFTATTFNQLVNPLVTKEKEKIVFFTNHRRKNGSLYPVEVHLQLVEEGNNKRFLAVILDTTERKKSEAARIMAEKNYQELFDKSNDAIYIHDIDTGQLIDVNYRATELTGFDKVDILEKAPSILFTDNPEYTIEKALDNIQKAAQGKPQVFEWLTKKKDGTSSWFEMTLKRTSIAGVDKILAFQRDITERKRSEEKLTQSEQKYRLLALQLQLQQVHLTNAQEVAKVGSWETDLTNLKLTWSDETYRIFETDRESFEATHESFLNYVHPDDREKVDKALLDSTQATAQTQHRIEHRIVTASGEVKVVEEHWKVTFGDKGEPLLAVGSCQDITERKKAEETILQANERFEKVTEATNDVIWDWDIESGTLFRSNAIDNFFGVGTSKVMDKKDFWRDNFHKEDISKIKSSMQKALEDIDCNRWEEEYRILNNNETIFVIDRGLILRNKSGKAIRMVGAMTNITEQKKQEGKLIELNQSLNEQAAELKRSNEELEQFAFVASHDLQEPLRMISSFMDQLKRKYEDRLDEKGLQYIHFATDGAKRMKQIILDLLLYSRANKPTDQNELINLNEIVSEYTHLRRKVIAEKKAAITCHGLPTIETYRAPISQIFHCLLDNALKYVDENIQPRIEIGAIEKENVWQFAIKDNGIGIDEKFFDKIFIIFQRLQNRKEHDGTGIGLAVAKRSVEFLGGKIWVESEIDKGSTFYFTILKIKQLI